MNAGDFLGEVMFHQRARPYKEGARSYEERARSYEKRQGHPKP